MRRERVDVLIAGSGFGGAVTAWRLAEGYLAGDADPSAITVLDRGPRLAHRDFKQSMDIDHLSSVYRLVTATGGQFVVGNAVGGGSNVYLAASLRAPSETFERRDRRPGDGDPRRMWPAALSRHALDPYYARAEAALRVRRPGWDKVSRAGGVWAALLDAAGHTCDRVPLAISDERCVDANWCHTGCIFGGKNSLITNYLAAAEAAGVRIRPLMEVESVRQTSARPYRYVVTVNRLHPRTRLPVEQVEIMCKVCVLACGALGDAPILLRSRHALPQLSRAAGRHVGCNGDHVVGVEIDSDRLRDVLGLPGYSHFHQGRPITTMTYDHYVGKPGNAQDGTRFTLQEIFLSTLTNVLYDDGRDPPGDPSWFGAQKKRAIAKWSSRIEILAMVEDTHDGTLTVPPLVGSAIEPNPGPISISPLVYQLSEQSRRVRAAADAAVREIVTRDGVGRFMGLTETPGVYAAHPLGGARMAESPEDGVVDDAGRVHGYEGLLCVGSSIIPTSLGVNPSLTITAVAERCADRLTADGPGLGLPVKLRRGVPPENVIDPVLPVATV
ncbi:MAG: GMC family oxidoreductase [Solirubrobacteraceae bacterium]|nr:GMC family oxidoreductase [Solirubrobacteraceae bacterium]